MTAPALSVPQIGAQRPRILATPPRMSSVGRDAVELAQIAGLQLDEWQCFVLDQALGVRADGTWSAFEVGLVVGRQNGKSVLLEARELYGLFLADEELLIHSAHLFDTSLECFNRILGLIESTPDLDRMVRRVSRSHGDEGIEVFRDGALRRLRFRTRTKGGGRGFSCDCLVMDEAMALGDQAVGAILPTLSAVPNPQVWYAGSAGDRDSTALGRVRSRGIAGSDPRLCYLEWSVEPCSTFCAPGCEAHDSTAVRIDPMLSPAETERQTRRLHASYARANPAYGIRIGGVRSVEKSIEHIGSESRAMSREEFLRERFGVGDWPVEGDGWRVIDKASWDACHRPASVPVGQLVFGIDMTPDRKMACIAVAGFNADGLTHVELTSTETLDHRPGDQWVVPRMAELAARWKPAAIVIDKASQAGSFIGQLENKGLEISSPTAREYAQACGSFGSAVVPIAGTTSTLAHRDQIPLTAAVAGAEKRDLADMWAWTKRGSATDISPLVAATLAMWGLHEKANEPKTSAPWAVLR